LPTTPIVVDDAGDDLAHVVRLGGVVGDDRVELGVFAVGIVLGNEAGRRLEVVRGQEAEQEADVL